MDGRLRLSLEEFSLHGLVVEKVVLSKRAVLLHLQEGVVAGIAHRLVLLLLQAEVLAKVGCV